MNKLFATALLCTALLSACGGSGEGGQATLPPPSTAVGNTALMATRGQQAPLAAAVPTAAGAMNWAQSQYPNLFPGTPEDQAQAPYVFRAYSTGNYLGVAGDSLYLLGPASGGTLVNVGRLGDFSCQVLPLQCAGLATNTGDTVIISNTSVMTFNRSDPSVLVTRQPITGLADFVGADAIVAIDYHSTGLLYAFGRAGHIYLLDPATGVASLQFTLLGRVPWLGTIFQITPTTRVDMDFTAAGDLTIQTSPITDQYGMTLPRTIIVNITNPNASTLTFGSVDRDSFAYSPAIEGAAISLQYWVNGDRIGGNTSNGWPLGVTASPRGGFDIEARTRNGYFISTASGQNTLYRVQANSATQRPASMVGKIGTSESIIGLALVQPSPIQVTGLVAGNKLVTFNAKTPNTILRSTPITGLANGEVLAGIDYRPADRQLYGVTTAGGIYRISDSGVATQTAQMNAPLVGSRFSVDFDPGRDRMRIIGQSGSNLEVNITTGQVVVLPTLTRTAGSLQVSAGPGVFAAAAFSDSYAGSGISSLQFLEATTSRLHFNFSSSAFATPYLTGLGVTLGDIATLDSAGPGNLFMLMALPTGPAGPSALYNIVNNGVAQQYPTGAASLSLVGGASGPLLLDIAIKP